MRHITAEEIGSLGIPQRAFAAMEWAFVALAQEIVVAPPRTYIELPTGRGLVMAACVPPDAARGFREAYVSKVINDVPGNAARGIATFQGLTTLYDAKTGQPVATFDAGALTALRTGVSTAVALDRLSPAGPIELGVLGCGPQAVASLAALSVLRPQLSVVTTERFLARLRSHIPALYVRGAESAGPWPSTMLTATRAVTPLTELSDEGIRVIAALGSYLPTSCEVPTSFVRSATVWIDGPSARSSGEIATNPDVQVRLFGHCLLESSPSSGRVLYKSSGSAAQDALMALVVEEALRTAKPT